MNKFTNTEWEGLTEEEIFLSNRRLVKATIKRKFSNHLAFCKTHMIEPDDLIQLGDMGLLNAIRTFNPNEKSSFRTHAINCISWNISAYARKYSLRTINTQSYELANVVSVETPIGGGAEGLEESIILDILESTDSTSDVAEDNVLGHSIIEFLKADKDVDEDLLYILIARTNGETMKSIAEHFGIHPNTLGERLTTQKATRVKKRLLKFLKNGD
jgi:RNA polymerase sigma factor (sigma-70 family)